MYNAAVARYMRFFLKEKHQYCCGNFLPNKKVVPQLTWT